MTISAKIIADSLSPEGVRITTYELEYPRFIHAEFMTHRQFSRNAASSRAIPIKKQIELIEENPAMPNHWGKHQPGMQADEECEAPVEVCDGVDVYEISRENAWLQSRDYAAEMAENFADAGYHKQIVNRILEPFSHIKVVCTATEYDNFFWLRYHKDAQPEIKELAKCMWEALEESIPEDLAPGDWHLPYYGKGYLKFENHDRWERQLEDALMISASCCAQVSYRKTDDSPEKAKRIYDALVTSKPVHASPFEHQATPIFENAGKVKWPNGTTHVCSDGHFWSGNFRGWIQHRQQIPDHVCKKFEKT